MFPIRASSFLPLLLTLHSVFRCTTCRICLCKDFSSVLKLTDPTTHQVHVSGFVFGSVGGSQEAESRM